ncbi:MAG: hypothetical protein AAEI08_02290 [Gammaproteobacteria bacterium]
MSNEVGGMTRCIVFVVGFASILVGCSWLGLGKLKCEDPEIYTNSGEIAPVQVPDDLSLPDEGESLEIPPELGESGVAQMRGPCLESPPEYFEGREAG